MNKSHKSDEYYFEQKSQSGKAGFEVFESSDGRFYFHFNDAEGKALLYSQAYKKAKDRDSGMASVIKNAAIASHFERKIDTTKKHYFILRAANRLEIARSRFFENASDMEAEIQYVLNSNMPETIVDKPQASTSATILEGIIAPIGVSKEEADLKAENELLKKRLILLESQLLLNENTEGVGDVTETKMPRHVFHIVMFNNIDANRIQGKITHPLTDDSCLFSGIDSQMMTDFILSKMNIEPNEGQLSKAVKVNEKAYYQVEASNNAIDEITEIVMGEAHSDVQSTNTEEVIAINLVNSKDSIRTHQAFSLVLTAIDTANIELGTRYFVKVYVFNFDTRERFLLLEKRGIWSKQERYMKVRVHPNALPIGSYRLTMTVDFGTTTGQSKPLVHNKWNGEGIIQVF